MTAHCNIPSRPKNTQRCFRQQLLAPSLSADPRHSHAASTVPRHSHAVSAVPRHSHAVTAVTRHSYAALAVPCHSRTSKSPALALWCVIFLSLTHYCTAGFTLEQGIPHFNTKPYFLDAPALNVTALEGQSAYLHCRVAQLGDKKVSWIRGRDLHVLTSSVNTFASDQRFLALHADRSENWTLHIRFSQTRDTGEYQCQVNTEPRISMSYYLTITEAATVLHGSDQRYVRAGSSIRLSCTTRSADDHNGLLYWYHGSNMLKDSDRVSIETSFKEAVSSLLVVSNARESDSGNYTCWPTKFKPVSTMVHVIPEEQPAAMSHGTVGGKSITVVTAASSAAGFLALPIHHQLPVILPAYAIPLSIRIITAISVVIYYAAAASRENYSSITTITEDTVAVGLQGSNTEAQFGLQPCSGEESASVT